MSINIVNLPKLKAQLSEIMIEMETEQQIIIIGPVPGCNAHYGFSQTFSQRGTWHS